MTAVSRRGFLGGVAAALTVTAFDPASQSWVTTAHAHGGRRRGIRVPRLDGVLTTDAGALAEAGEDFGYIRRSTPWAVLQPGSHRDVVRMVRYCNRVGIKIAMRGQAHSVFGQAQADGGLVVDSRTLNTIHTIASDHAWVDAGVVWRDFVGATTAVGLACPVLTDYLGLSIGGVLSVGGVGGASHQHGLVVDQCEELEVVTGDGRWVRCSPTRRPALFNAILGGLGQYALILKAKIRLAPQLPFARVYQLTYPTLASYLADQRRLNADERFDFLEGQVAPNPTGGWIYVIQAAKWFDPAAGPPDDAALIGDLSPLPGGTQIDDLPFIVWANRVEQFVQFWIANGLWTTPHPWSDLFLPDDNIESYVSNVLAGLTPADVGAGVQLLYPFKRSRVSRPLVQLPCTDTVWLYDILRFPVPDPAVADALVAANRVLYDDAVVAGGKRYPISAVPMEPRDWVNHYGGSYFRVVASKARFDRNNTLTPGQGIFRG